LWNPVNRKGLHPVSRKKIKKSKKNTLAKKNGEKGTVRGGARWQATATVHRGRGAIANRGVSKGKALLKRTCSKFIWGPVRLGPSKLTRAGGEEEEEGVGKGKRRGDVPQKKKDAEGTPVNVCEAGRSR